MHLWQLDSRWVATGGEERYLIILSQNCIQIEVDSVEKVNLLNFFNNKKNWIY